MLPLLFGDPATATALHQTGFAQPAIFALEYALYRLWDSWGVKPAVCLGHSVGEYTVADLIPEALRQNLSRLIVGEVRGGEAGAMFEAMQSGAGTMSTTHSHSAASTMDRLAARVAQGGVLGVSEAYRQIALNLHLLIHVCLVDDTWRGGTRKRFISEVRELTGAVENGRPVTHLAYRADEHGRALQLQPSAELLGELRAFRGHG